MGGTNPTSRSRRAFSVNYADGRTKVLDPKPIVKPEGTSGPKLGFQGTSLRLFSSASSLSSECVRDCFFTAFLLRSRDVYRRFFLKCGPDDVASRRLEPRCQGGRQAGRPRHSRM